MKNNVLPFPSLRSMPPDPPRTLRQRLVRPLKRVLLITAVTGVVVGIVILINVLFS